MCTLNNTFLITLLCLAQVRQRDFPSLHLLYEVLVAMFAEEYDGMLEKTARKRLAREKVETHMKLKEM